MKLLSFVNRVDKLSLSQNKPWSLKISYHICEVRFFGFEISNLMTSWHHFAHFFFLFWHSCSDFLRNLRQGTKLSSNVCHWKSEKSFSNFRQYGELRFRKKKSKCPKKKKKNRNRVSISDITEPLISKMTIFCRFEWQILLKKAKNSKFPQNKN